ncbi:MAG: lipocalin family protein [Flavobacteriia bacterium]|nr:lipocalin family protein [Flavobacteriia bacterium]
MKLTLGWMGILLLTASCATDTPNVDDLKGAWKGHSVKVKSSDPNLQSVYRNQYKLHETSILSFSENKTYRFQELTTHTTSDGHWKLEGDKLMISNFGDTLVYKIVSLSEDSLITSNMLKFNDGSNGEKSEIEVIQTYARAN